MESSKGLLRTASDQTARKRNARAKWTLFTLVIVALFVGCIGCIQCRSCKVDDTSTRVVRTPVDVTDLSVVFINGEATLFWTDSKDSFLDHIEIAWGPGWEKPVRVAKGVETCAIPGLEAGKVYNFTVKAVDQWGNKSTGVTGGTGRAYKQRKPAYAPPDEIMGIRGTPVAGQATLSWTNLDDSEYDHIEITYDLNSDVLIRVPKGVESRTLTGLVNGLEHTFYAVAVDAQGNRKSLKEVGLFISNNATSPESVSGRSAQGQITLVWNDPVNPKLDHLEIVCNSKDGIPVIVPKGVQAKTFTDLYGGTNHEFTVYAADAAGHRRPLTGVNLYTPAAPFFDDSDLVTVKGKPVAGQIHLDWDDPIMAGLDHVEIIYNSGSGDNLVAVGKGIQTKTFTGLSGDQEYEFLVYGVDSRGNKRAVKGIRLTAPEAPKITAKPLSRQVTIVWIDPADPNLSHIEVGYRPGGENPVKVAKGVQKHTFTGLSDNVEYEFFINAITIGGNDYAIPGANAVVPKLPVLAGKPTNGRISLAWKDPKNVNVDHVEIVYSPGGQKARKIAKGTENHTFTGLTNGKEYAFTLYAVDAAGNQYPINSTHFYTPEAAAARPPTPPLQSSQSSPPVHPQSPKSPPPQSSQSPKSPQPQSPPPQSPQSSSPVQKDQPGSLAWQSVRNTSFGESTILALAYGSIANGSNRWVAGGTDGKLAYSTDNGINWIAASEAGFGSFSINAIGYNNGRWIAVGNSGRMAWSTNAANWIPVKETHFKLESSINAVAYGNRCWIAGGTGGQIIISEDNGVTWRPVAVNGFGQSSINAVMFHGNRWVIGGARGKIAYSDNNGQTWNTSSNSAFGDADVTVIVFDKGRWMAGGYGNRIVWSSDGINWRGLDRPFYILGMGYNGKRWVAGGQEGRMAWSMDGGDNWIQDNKGRNFFGDNWIRAVAFGRTSATSGRWISAGQKGTMLYADE